MQYFAYICALYSVYNDSIQFEEKMVRIKAMKEVQNENEKKRSNYYIGTA